MGREFKKSKIIKIPLYNKLMAKYLISLRSSIASICSFATKNKFEYKPDLKAAVPSGFVDTIKEILSNKVDGSIAFPKATIPFTDCNLKYVLNQLHGEENQHGDPWPAAEEFVQLRMSVLAKVKALKSASELLGDPMLLEELTEVFEGKYKKAAKFALDNPVLAVDALFPIVSVYQEILDQDSSEGGYQLKDEQKIKLGSDNAGYKEMISGWFSSVLSSFVHGAKDKKVEDQTVKEEESGVSQDDDQDKDALPSYTSGDVDAHFQNQVDMVTGHAKHFCYNYAKLNIILLDFCDFNFQMETPLDNEIAGLALHEFATMTQQLVRAPQGTGGINLIGDGSTLLLGDTTQDNAQKQITGGEL